mgnify:CR=1 FL=1
MVDTTNFAEPDEKYPKEETIDDSLSYTNNNPNNSESKARIDYLQNIEMESLEDCIGDKDPPDHAKSKYSNRKTGPN